MLGTGVTSPTLGIWLFLASEIMLFGSLFSAYALIREGAERCGALPVQFLLHLRQRRNCGDDVLMEFVADHEVVEIRFFGCSSLG